MEEGSFDIGNNAKFDHLVLGAESLDVDEKGKDITVEATGDTNAHLGLYGVKEGKVDQSDAKITVKGGSGKSTVLNRIDHCGDMEVNQDNTNTVIEAADGANLTAVNYITDTKNYKASYKNSVIRVNAGNRQGGITAHTIVGGNSVVNITSSNTVSYVG